MPRTIERQEQNEQTREDRLAEIRRRYEEARKEHERARRRYEELDRRHEKIRRASGLRGALRVLFPPLTRGQVIVALVLSALTLALAVVLMLTVL